MPEPFGIFLSNVFSSMSGFISILFALQVFNPMNLSIFLLAGKL